VLSANRADALGPCHVPLAINSPCCNSCSKTPPSERCRTLVGSAWLGARAWGQHTTSCLLCPPKSAYITSRSRGTRGQARAHVAGPSSVPRAGIQNIDRWTVTGRSCGWGCYRPDAAAVGWEGWPSLTYRRDTGRLLVMAEGFPCLGCGPDSHLHWSYHRRAAIHHRLSHLGVEVVNF
jgi:hypothetical protein